MTLTHAEPHARASPPKLMARPATGQVLKPDGRRRSFGLRFRAYGKRETIRLGRPEDGWTTHMAERELAVVLRDVDLGTWRPKQPDPAPERQVDPTFLEFSSDWFEAKQLEIEPNTVRSYRNDLENHLLPFFKDHHLSQITVEEVDRYRQAKVRHAAELAAAIKDGKPRTIVIEDKRGRRYRRVEKPLSARSINMHIDLLAQILTLAVDHKHIESNPAIGKRRRLKVSKPRPVHLDSAEHIAMLLEAAAALDAGDRVVEVLDRRGRTYEQHQPLQTTGRRAAIAVLLLGGLRASATGALLWRDVDLANGRFEVGRDKTDAGMREIDMLPLLREILTEHKAASEKSGPDDPVLVTSTGKPRSRHNLRQDVVEPVVRHAEEIVARRGAQPLPIGITPHKLRHTFASVLVAIGRDPTYVMNQLGHTDPAFTLRVYSHMMRRSPEERERLKALVEGHVWAHIGHKTADSASPATGQGDA
jgi:integrase